MSANLYQTGITFPSSSISHLLFVRRGPRVTEARLYYLLDPSRPVTLAADAFIHPTECFYFQHRRTKLDFTTTPALLQG